MASITHKKVGTIPDWTQADVDTQIALGNLPPGTTPAKLQLTSDWNETHNITGLQPSLVAGTNITIDNTDPNAPIINASGGGVTSVTAADTTLTISPTTGAVIAGLNLANANIWTAKQTIRLTTQQFTLGYDASNRLDLTVASDGSTTLDLVGTNPFFTFNDPATFALGLTNSALTNGRIVVSGASGAQTDFAGVQAAANQIILGIAGSAVGSIKFQPSSGVQTVTVQGPASLGSSLVITLPSSVSSQGIYFNSAGGAMSVVSAVGLTNGGTNATSYGASRVVHINSGNTAFSSTSGFTFATPKLTLVAATTAGASLTIPAGTAPTSPVDGDLWTDSTQKALLCFQAGITQSPAGCIFTQTADKSVTNTTTETSIVGTGTRTLTLPANFFVIGKTIRITMSGVYSTVAVTGDTVTIKIKYGSTVLASKATTALVTGGTNLYWESEVLVTCRTTGASGTVQVSGGVRYQIAASAIVEDELNNSVGTTTLNTTASSLLDVTVTHSAADASNTVKSLVASFEVLN